MPDCRCDPWGLMQFRLGSQFSDFSLRKSGTKLFRPFLPNRGITGTGQLGVRLIANHYLSRRLQSESSGKRSGRGSRGKAREDEAACFGGKPEPFRYLRQFGIPPRKLMDWKSTSFSKARLWRKMRLNRMTIFKNGKVTLAGANFPPYHRVARRDRDEIIGQFKPI